MADGWLLLCVLPLVCIACAHTWRWVSAHLGRRVTWFQLLPAGAGVQWDDFRHVVASTRRAMISGRVLIARFGTEHSATDIWMGIAGSKQPTQIAQSMARAAGSQVGAEGEPPWPDVHGMRWRVGYTEEAPGKGELDATEAYLRSLDTRTIPEKPTFPSACSDYFRPDDVFVAMCQPTDAPTRIRAMCLTTAVGLDMSFSEAAEMRRGLLHISAAWVPLLVGTVSCAAAGIPLLAVWTSVPSLAVRALPMALMAGWAATFLWNSLKSPVILCSLLAGRAPRYPRAASKGKLLPVWQMGEWSAGDDFAGTAAPMKPAPPQALSTHGALIGTDPVGQECRLPDELRYRGVITYGDPGHGKTTFLLNLLAHDAARRASGDHISIVWIETKGEGAQRATQVMEAHGASPLMLVGAAPVGPRLELVDRSKPAESGRLLTEAIRYSFEVDDIHQASADVLASAFEAAIAFPPDAAREIGVQCEHLPNVVDVAFRILGGIPEEFSHVQKVLSNAVPKHHRQSVERFFARRSFDRDRLTDPAKNKLRDLQSVSGLFEPLDRQQTTFSTLLHAAQPTVLNLGRIGASGINGRSEHADSAYTELTAQRAAAIAMFMLWHTIQTECDAWQAAGKSVAIYSDELKDIGGFGKHGLEIVQAMADQGRSRGVLPSFGTQRPDQLVPTTRAAVDSFSTQAIFKLRAPVAATAASEQLFGEYTPEQITALPRGFCALSIAADGRTPAAFTLHPANL